MGFFGGHEFRIVYIYKGNDEWDIFYGLEKMTKECNAANEGLKEKLTYHSVDTNDITVFFACSHGEWKNTTEAYYECMTEKTALGSTAEVTAGTKIYIKPADLTETCNILRNITFNGESVFNDTHFDEREGAYCVTMPEKYALLTVTYEMANIFLDSKPTVQVSVGDELKVGDYASLYADGAKLSDRLTWKIIADPDGALELHDNQLKAVKKGAAVVWACAAANNNLYVPLTVKVYDTLASMAEITYDNDNIVITSTYNDTEEIIPYSGYLVEKGATLTVKPVQTDGTIPLWRSELRGAESKGRYLSAQRQGHVYRHQKNPACDL